MTASTPLKVIQDHRFRYQSKARMPLPISEYYYILSCAVSKLRGLLVTFLLST